jgi:hypothetical protein
VEHRIRAYEEAEIWIDSHQERGVDPLRVLPQFMKAPVSGPVRGLKAMLCTRLIPGGLRASQERVRDDACPFA